MTRALLIPVSMLLLSACGDKDDDTAQVDDTAVADDTASEGLPQAYAFTSALTGEDSVSYSGQVFRQLLIDDMKSHLGGMTERINNGWYPEPGEVAGELLFYFEFDSSVGGSLEHLRGTDPAALQTTYDDVSSGKDLVAKLAGNDATGQHADWNQDMVGWERNALNSPESLVLTWIDQIDQQAVDWSLGNPPMGPDGQPVPAVFVTPDGHDLQQLLEKFLRGGVAFSQGADDYLDDDLEGKGLNSEHSVAEEGKPYTALEHAWDEGFGYFGAARSWPSWTDDQIADQGHRDDDGDGAVDLTSEYNWGHAGNAAKRDRGSSEQAPTDFTAQAWEGFASGRQLLADTAGDPLSAEQLAELQGHRDVALQAWEAAIAASVVHYINEVLQDGAAIGTSDYSYADHAKHWSELKGFAMAPQFNPRSPMSDDDFAAMHGHLGTAPALRLEQLDDYNAGLLQARALIGAAYGFDAANLGDDGGLGGW